MKQPGVLYAMLAQQSRANVTKPKSDWHKGFDACFAKQPLDDKQSKEWQRGWRMCLEVEAQAITPPMEEWQ